MSRIPLWFSFVGVACVVGFSTPAAMNVSLSRQDIERALAVARSSDVQRTQFHAPYLFEVNTSTVKRVEVITEFRRAVLITEEHLRQGNWIFGHGGSTLAGENLPNALQPWRGRVSVVAHVQFHPLNAYADVPPLRILLDTVPALASQTRGQSSLYYETSPGQFATHLIGAAVETTFSAATVGRTTHVVTILREEKSIGQVTVDFARLE